jgi:hypothetical protein
MRTTLFLSQALPIRYAPFELCFACNTRSYALCTKPPYDHGATVASAIGIEIGVCPESSAREDQNGKRSMHHSTPMVPMA